MASRYLVELAPPPGGWQALQHVASRARDGAEELSREGLAVRFLRSIFVPEEEICFFLYEAESVASVNEAGRRAQLQILRIDETLHAEPGEPPTVS
ncbi:MAG: DUF4242 domain-containing protein [Solirubrobacteraceae bacterium]|jgi:hypothetical protein